MSIGSHANSARPATPSPEDRARPGEPSPEAARKLRTLCHQRGVLIEVGGHYGNVGRFLPPLVITRELAKKGFEIVAESICDVEKEL